MNKVSVILEDNPEKLMVIFDRYRKDFFHNPVFYFMSEHHARRMIDSITQSETKALPMYTLYLDDELIPGGGYGTSFLNWMIDNLPSQIEKVIVTSYRDSARKEMTELCVENLIATELFPLPFSGG